MFDKEITEGAKAAKENAKFKQICGEILRMGISVETNLELFIRDYFQPIVKYRENELNYWIMIDLTFEKKIQIIERICKENRIDDNLKKNIIKNIRDIQKIRNLVAHGKASVTDAKTFRIKLHKKKLYNKESDSIIISDKIVSEINGKLGDIYEWLMKLKEQIEKNKDKTYE